MPRITSPTQVIVVTNIHYTAGGVPRVGVRYMTNGLKVYYMPILPCFDQVSLPGYYSALPLFRKILLRERVTLVHGHAATSVLAHECLLAARLLGVRTVFTDHSLFGFADAASINVNKYLKFTLSCVDAAISVSHTGRENLALRASLAPSRIATIPNAVDASRFTPDLTARPPTEEHRVNVVLLSRLVYRKGIDLVAELIPAACARWPEMRFIIGGDGPKRALLEAMRDVHGLHGRVELLGAVPHAHVRDVLVRGHIFLNASLTEAFCIALLEAACSGCFVVSTRVGGVPEVLPPECIRLAEPNVADLLEALGEALPLALRHDAAAVHARLARAYSWPDVAARTVAVYDAVAARPLMSLDEALMRWLGAGRVFGVIGVILMSLLYFFTQVLEVFDPADSVEVCPALCLNQEALPGTRSAAAHEGVEDDSVALEPRDEILAASRMRHQCECRIAT